MRLSQYFLPILKENPKEAEIISHRLMLRAGMVRQQTSGIYSWLPLGKKALDKICAIIREEQERAGALEVLMPTVQSADLWRESGRYDDYGLEMLRIKDRQERDLLYGPTNEEMITDIFRSHIRSYRDLPIYLYQIQWKFRDEIRPRFGVMRSREFLMKDAYSFDLDYDSAKISYNRMFVAYLRTFFRTGLQVIPMRADTGPIGGELSHEFIILAETGESTIFCDRRLLEMTTSSITADFKDSATLENIVKQWTAPYAATEEMHDEREWSKVPENNRLATRGIEVGHIFYFGTKYSIPMGVKIMGKDGKESPVFMGSYGIGPSRLVAAVIEASHDENGIIWPKQIAPFDFGIINIKPDDEKCNHICETLYQGLINAGFDPLLDDKNERPGSKFSTMDLIGLPTQIIVGPKGALQNEVEIKDRKTGTREVLTVEAALNMFSRSL
ncbi:proline--tRNA ligase [Bartonella ancashensis]|uniref:Proline--tRNA ligase n=1 Tax=Bartonella ancashensis TaxID=1318743 RepID=A0A0M3T338_9HYPH|nr:proline--tRNA ligase [Bartonella ancashensis]ALE03805.1 Prolyl-tRNA synthetase [Bartonella ancashensis]